MPPAGFPCREGGSPRWLALGAGYAVTHLTLSGALRDNPAALGWFGNLALVIPPMLVAGALFRWRDRWSGCQGVFWGAFAVGAATWTVGQVFWAVEEILLDRPLPWLQWHAVLNLCGSAAPLLALLARPHDGVRRGLASPTILQIAGFALFVAYLHAYFVVAPSLGGEGVHTTSTLVGFAQAQRTLVVAGLVTVAFLHRDSDWGPTYRRLALGGCLGLSGRTLASVATTRDLYFTGSPYDLAWILPHFFTLWAADLAPRSGRHEEVAGPMEPYVAAIPFRQSWTRSGMRPRLSRRSLPSPS